MQEDRVISELSLQYSQKIHKNEDESRIFDFSRLPWMVFLNILKFFTKEELCRICLVNKLWQKACRDPSLWQYLNFVEYQSISNEDLIRLTSYSSNVAKLKIAQCKVLTDSGLIGALKQCSTLVECSIVNCRDLSDDVLSTLGEYCHVLKKLDITLCLGFSNIGIKKVCEGCPELEEIVIDQCAKLTNETLEHLGRHCNNLKCISAEIITNITDEGLFALLQGCRELQTLQFPFCGLTNRSISQIVQYCVKIVYLDVRGVLLEDNDVSSMVMSLTKLETLNLGLCHNLTDASAMEIGMHCKKLKHLFLVKNKVTDEGLLQLSVHCVNLLHLDVSWCEAVTEVGARYILSGCRKLKRLGLFRCDKVSESAVNQLIMEFSHVFISTLQTEMSKSLSKKQDDVL